MARAKRGLTDHDIEAIPAPTRPGQREVIKRHGRVPGLLIRVGRRKRSWELRIERPPRVNRHLGTWPRLNEEQAVAEATRLWRLHDAGKPLDEPDLKVLTVQTAWPLHEAWLKRKRAPLTVSAYQDSYDRLSPEVLAIPLAELAARPMLMAREADRIAHKKGPAAALASARFVSALFKHVRTRIDTSLQGNPCGAVDVVVKANPDLPVLSAQQLPEWLAEVRALPSPVVQAANLFSLFSGWRRAEVCALRWEHVDIKGRKVLNACPKGGESKAYEMPLSRALLRVLWQAKKAGEMMAPREAQEWCFPSRNSRTDGHITELTKNGLSAAGHAMRRTYHTLGFEAGVTPDVIHRLLGRGAPSGPHKMVLLYVRTSALGEYLGKAQETISQFIVKALGSPRGL